MKKFWFYIFGIYSFCSQSCDFRFNVDNPEETHFLKFYGKDGDQTGKDLVILPDGNLMLFGTTKLAEDENGTQWFLVKVDSKGYVIWEKTFGGKYDETASDIELTNFGIVLVGNSQNENNNLDIFVMTLTLEGTKIDSTIIGLETDINPSTNEDCKSVTVIPNGFLITGSTTSTGLKANLKSIEFDTLDAFHLRLNNDLTEYSKLWTRKHGPGSVDVGIKILPSSSPTYPFYFFGYTNKAGFSKQSHLKNDFNFWYFGLTEYGESSTDYFLGDFENEEKLSSVVFSDGLSNTGFLLGGVYNNSSTSDVNDFFIGKVSSNLSFDETDIQYQHSLNSTLDGAIDNNMVILASNLGGIWILGNEYSIAGSKNWVLTKLNSRGNTVWKTPLVLGGEGLDSCGGIKELSNGHVLIIGTMRTGRPESGEFKMTLIKVNDEGLLI